jgi:hypothetical protein
MAKPFGFSGTQEGGTHSIGFGADMTDEREVTHIYIDESSQTDNRYLFWTPSLCPPATSPGSRWRWRRPDSRSCRRTHVGQGLEIERSERMSVLRVFFVHPEAHFHSIVVDTSMQRHRVVQPALPASGVSHLSGPAQHGPSHRGAAHHHQPRQAQDLGRSRDWRVRKLHFSTGWTDRFFRWPTFSPAPSRTTAMATTNGRALAWRVSSLRR